MDVDSNIDSMQVDSEICDLDTFKEDSALSKDLSLSHWKYGRHILLSKEKQ